MSLEEQQMGNGVSVDRDTAAVLTHLLDEFDDHLGNAYDPNFTFTIGEFNDLGDDNNYKAKDDGPGHKFNAPVMCKYTINGNDIESDYFAVDNVFFEMYPAMTKDGSIAKNHGTSWMNVYLTQAGFSQFYNKFATNTTWGIKNTVFRNNN
jgi:hypothetical protein